MSITAAETVVEGAATAAKVGLSALSWLPWAIAAGSFVIGAGGTLWYRSEYESCLAAGAKALADQIEVDKRDNAKAVGDLNKLLQTNERKIMPAVEKVYAAPQTNACANSPAMRAASDGLRQLFPGGQADDRRGVAPAVPGSAAGAAGQPQR